MKIFSSSSGETKNENIIALLIINFAIGSVLAIYIIYIIIYNFYYSSSFCLKKTKNNYINYLEKPILIDTEEKQEGKEKINFEKIKKNWSFEN